MFSLSPFPPASRTILEELDAATAVAATEPLAGEATLSRVRLLFRLGHDGEIIGTLDAKPFDPSCADALERILARTLVERGEPQDLERAEAMLLRMAAGSRTARARAAAAADLSKAMLARGRPEEARRIALAALADDPDSALGWMRFARACLACGDAAGLLARAEARIADGAPGAGPLASRDLALAVLERRTCSALQGLERGRLNAPAGWPSLDAFNKALTAELLAHPGQMSPRTVGPGRVKLRINEPLLKGRSPVFAALVPQLVEMITRRARAVEAADPWGSARPEQAELRLWSIVSHGSGHDIWHLHAEAWLSGVYYVHVPDGSGGDIEFGCPELPLAASSPNGETLRVRPRAGDWVSFPSHLHHRTWPTGSPERRVAVAFDVVPAGL